MRIRKRSAAATSSELHESSNGGLYLHTIFKSSPSFHDPTSSLISPASIIKQDHLLFQGSGLYGAATHGPLQKQLPAEAVSLKRKKLCTVVSSGVESCKDDKGLTIRKGEGSPGAKTVQHINEVKHMPIHAGDYNVKGLHMQGWKERGLLGTSCREADKLSEACKKVRHNVACKGSALHDQINTQADLAIVDASDCPRKVRPLQLFLSNDYSPSTAPKLPLPLCPRSSSSSSTMPSTPPPLPRKFDKALPSALTKTPPLPSPVGGSLMKQIPDVKPRDEMRLVLRNENASSGNTSDRAEFESCALNSSWQGHCRPRSHGGRRCPGLAAGNGELRKPSSATKNKAHKKTPDKPLLMQSTSAACLLPLSAKMIGSLETKPSAGNTLTTSTYDHASAASDHELLQLDSMRCRRKDGRRWRCKAQVVKAGAPFCHYHTLKMREKHAASIVRKLCMKLQGEGKIKSSHEELSRSCSTKRVNKRRSVRSSPSRKAVHHEYGGGDCKAAEVDEYEEGEHEDEVEEEDDKNDQPAGKLQTKRRWRKKCKPCIRRLHDIHDRARPATTDGLDFFNPEVEDTSNLDVRCCSPLPECLLNTDPYEWRSPPTTPY